MTLRSLLLGVAFLGLCAWTITAGEDSKLQGVKCLLNPKAAAKAETGVDYKGGKVYFCCNNCAGKFKADPAKHAERANQQLVASKQAKQENCPFSGAPCKPEHKLSVAGVDVCFCCPNCQAKVAKAEADEQLKMVFNDKAFEKAFKLAKQDKP